MLRKWLFDEMVRRYIDKEVLRVDGVWMEPYVKHREEDKVETGVEEGSGKGLKRKRSG